MIDERVGTHTSPVDDDLDVYERAASEESLADDITLLVDDPAANQWMTQAKAQAPELGVALRPRTADTGAKTDGSRPAEASTLLDRRRIFETASGERVSKMDVLRIGIGFTLCAMLTAIPWTIINSIILPSTFESIDPGTKEAMASAIGSFGSVIALLANIVFGTLSDMTRSRFGKRAPWILSGALITTLALGACGFVHTIPAIFALFACVQIGFNMMLAPAVATMSDRVPDKMRVTVSSYYGAGGVVGNTLGMSLGAVLAANGSIPTVALWLLCAGFIGCSGLFVLLIWPRERSTRDERRVRTSAKEVLMRFRPPCNAPDFYRALVGRTLMMAGYFMVANFQLFIGQDYIFEGAPNPKVSALQLMGTMSVITFVVSILTSLVAGPITNRIGRRKAPVAVSSCMFALGAVMPILFRDAMGMYLYAVIAGFGYGLYSAIDQALNVAVLPNPDDAGKDLGVLNLSNTISQSLGPVLGGIIATSLIPVMQGAAYRYVFGCVIVLSVAAAVIIMRIRSVK